MRISDWSSDVCSSDLHRERRGHGATRRWPLGCEGGHGGGGREEHVDLREEGRCVEGQLLARSDRTGELRHRVGLSLLEDAAAVAGEVVGDGRPHRSEEHTSELQSLMRISYAVFCLK